MGKYMKKSEIAGSVAAMEVSPQSCIGVCTRAKTLALQRLHDISKPTALHASSFSYLQLRSRRLEKPSVLVEAKEQPKGRCRKSHEPNNLNMGLVNSGSMGSLPSSNGKSQVCVGDNVNSIETEEYMNVGVEASLEENCLETEGRDRSNSESAPCSFIRDSDSDTIGTPGSTTWRKSCSRNGRLKNGDMQRSIPIAHEMEEFFVYAEQQQQRVFIEKYNFDVVNEVALSGRYEWVSVLN